MVLQLSSILELDTWNDDTVGLDFIGTIIRLSNEGDAVAGSRDNNIGTIEAYRFDLSLSKYRLFRGAESISADLAYLMEWLLALEREDGLPDELIFPDYMFYIQSVYIEPEYRKNNCGLFATLFFLDTFAKDQVVACNPSPIEDLRERYSQQGGRDVLKRYWARLGLTNYEPKHNLLWEGAWIAPSALMSKLNVLYPQRESTLSQK